MDYNYVRMRNALSNGDAETAERYRRIYEKNQKKPKESQALNIIIVILLVIATALGIYIVLASRADSVIIPETVAGTEEPPAVVSQPETN